MTEPATTQPDIAAQLAALNDKMDAIQKEIVCMKRQRRELAELKDDLTLVSKDLFQSTVLELEEVAPFVQTGDFLYLFKRLIRNTRNFTAMLEMLESVADLWADVRPIGNELFNDTLEKFDEFDRRGYFAFFRGVLQVLDRVIAHVSPQDLQALADNVGPLVELMKRLGQPELIAAISAAAANLEVSAPKKYPLWRVLLDSFSRDMRQTMRVGMTFMKDVGHHIRTAGDENPTQPQDPQNQA